MEKPFYLGESIARERAISGSKESFPQLDIKVEVKRALDERNNSEDNIVSQKMKDMGLERVMGEMMLDKEREDIPVVIVRPSVIEGTYIDPIPGWIEGIRFDLLLLATSSLACMARTQKGVISLLESQENFLFTRRGIVPDLVINPHAFPTQQTPGQLLEAALRKGIDCSGLTRYATPLTTPSIDDIIEQLHRAGFSRWGHERVCSGHYGEMLDSMIFIGPTFYQRLTHMAEDKVKFGNTRPVQPLTRQPVQDRKRFGGVKFGEKERDCLLAHGAAANLHERLFTLSNFSQMQICSKCDPTTSPWRWQYQGALLQVLPVYREHSEGECAVWVQVALPRAFQHGHIC